MDKELTLKAAELLKEVATTLKSVDVKTAETNRVVTRKVISLDIEALSGE